MDKHFRTAPLEKYSCHISISRFMEYQNFLGAQTEAILPYDQYLHRFAAYFQQIEAAHEKRSIPSDR